MLYTQDIFCQPFSSSEHAEEKESLASFLTQGTHPALSIVRHRDDLDDVYAKAHLFRDRFEDIVILGTGGSSLGAQTLCALKYVGLGFPQASPRLYFMDNIDPETFADLREKISLKTTGVIAISKSGTTAETLFQTSLFLEEAKRVRGDKVFKDHFLFITEPKDSPLRRLALTQGIPVLDHPENIGGRFSVFSVVGALPAFLAGVDFLKVRKGAEQTLNNPSHALQGSLFINFLYQVQNIQQTVLMPYLDKLFSFAGWFRQLWAESLGKEGRGLTPLRALGTVDQHSQTQLYLEGPRDKSFTFIKASQKGRGDTIAPTDPDLTYLRGKSMGDLLEAEQRATITSFVEKGLPLRVLSLENLHEETLGALLMHFMIETLLVARFLKIDPLTQPAVERGKVLTRTYLAEG